MWNSGCQCLSPTVPLQYHPFQVPLGGGQGRARILEIGGTSEELRKADLLFPKEYGITVNEVSIDQEGLFDVVVSDHGRPSGRTG